MDDSSLLRLIQPFLNGKMQLAALWYLAGKLEPDRRYSEAELNDLLDAWSTFHDPATLRRELYNKKLVTARNTGAVKAFRLLTNSRQNIFERQENTAMFRTVSEHGGFRLCRGRT